MGENKKSRRMMIIMIKESENGRKKERLLC